MCIVCIFIGYFLSVYIVCALVFISFCVLYTDVQILVKNNNVFVLFCLLVVFQTNNEVHTKYKYTIDGFISSQLGCAQGT